MAENSFLALVGLFGLTPDDLLKLANASPRYAHAATLPTFLLASLSFGRLVGVFFRHVAMVPKSALQVFEPRLVVLCFECPGTIQIDTGAGGHAADGQQPEWLWFQRLATLQGVGQHSGNKGAEANAPSGCDPPHLICKAVEMGNCCSHDEEHIR